MDSKNEISAGGVVFKKTNEGTFVLVCKHSGYHKWVLPKGLVEKGEKLEETAIREVEEEAGVKAKIIEPIGTPEKYVYILNGTRIFKTVHYFLMEYVSGEIDTHDFEMEDVRWVSPDEALHLVEYEGAKRIVEKAIEMLKR
ncbi:MAG TPA: NUDIX hydrolase [Patescibacteria group bacterium]|nr:NUDIX hydrolase [Patescibacteria group bacterium]